MMTNALEVVVEGAAKTNFVAVEEAEAEAPTYTGMPLRMVDRNGARVVAGEVAVAARLNMMVVVADIGYCLHTEIHHHTDWMEEGYFATIVADVGLVVGLVEENVAAL